MRSIAGWVSAGLLVGLCWPGLARADESITVDIEAAPQGEVTRSAASVGVLLPFSHAASIEDHRAQVATIGGYDSSRRSGTFEALTEVRLWGPISIRGGAVYMNGDRTLRPSVGGRIQLLHEGRQGVDGALGVFYRPEGLTEPEGEIETVISVGSHVGASYLLGCLLYGQDPEGNERDGEVRVAALRPTRYFLVGFDSRLRFDLGSNSAKLLAHHEPTMDALIGPLATVFVGPVALSVQGGASALRSSGQADTLFGVFAMAGVGTVF